jgi:hypothetical protein
MQERSRTSYAKARLNLAMQRLLLARTQQEEDSARRWVTAWGAAIGESHFRGFGLPRSIRSRAAKRSNGIMVDRIAVKHSNA